MVSMRTGADIHCGSVATGGAVSPLFLDDDSLVVARVVR